MKRIIGLILVLIVGGVGLAACSSGTSSAVNADTAKTNSQLDIYQKNQPIPAFSFSQYRQTLIDIENAQATAVATTTFFFNYGIPDPIKVCPSIGFPVASTSELTNPNQLAWTYHDGGSTDGVVQQMDPTGVYTGQSSGTYVVCIASNGTKYITYWEGDVQTEGGPAHWDYTLHRIVLDGAPTVVAKTKADAPAPANPKPTSK